MFDKAYVINLKSRPERWQRIKAFKWPWRLSRVEAIHGKTVGMPDWWQGGPGAWGCWQTHMHLMERCINEGWPHYLVLEDDATPEDTLTDRLPAVFEQIPDDWDQLYLGGQHLHSKSVNGVKGIPVPDPEQYSADLLRVNNVNRTHAFALSQAGARKMYAGLWSLVHRVTPHHIDHLMGELHPKLRTFAVHPWLVHQAFEEHESDVRLRNGEPSVVKQPRWDLDDNKISRGQMWADRLVVVEGTQLAPIVQAAQVLGYRTGVIASDATHQYFRQCLYGDSPDWWAFHALLRTGFKPNANALPVLLASPVGTDGIQEIAPRVRDLKVLRADDEPNILTWLLGNSGQSIAKERVAKAKTLLAKRDLTNV